MNCDFTLVDWEYIPPAKDHPYGELIGVLDDGRRVNCCARVQIPLCLRLEMTHANLDVTLRVKIPDVE